MSKEWKIVRKNVGSSDTDIRTLNLTVEFHDDVNFGFNVTTVLNNNLESHCVVEL